MVLFKTVAVMFVILFAPSITFSQLYINGNSNFYINTGAQVQVNMNTSVTNATSVLRQVGNSYLRMSGNLTNNGSVNLDRGFTLGGNLILNNAIDFTTNSTTITFYGPTSQTVTSPSATVSLYEWVIDKTGGYVFTGNEVVVNSVLRLISNAIVDIGIYNLTMGINTTIFSDYGTAKVFSNTQCVYNSQGINSGSLVRRIDPSASLPLPTLRFPLGTPGTSGDVYTPAEINLISGSLSPGSQIAIKAIRI
ncbi:MAG: hypothetical protein HZB41_06045 [Ignavibacteriae bacterium]|nr:hypothetical protein [Ignavibacteriota bacterium]